MIILDTCAFVWLVDSPGNLSRKAIEAIEGQNGALAVLPISAWEIAIKCRQGGILMKKGIHPLEWYNDSVKDYGLHEISLNAGLLCASASLPFIHRDPCDRMIIAAAIGYKCPIITADRIFSKYPELQVIW